MPPLVPVKMATSGDGNFEDFVLEGYKCSLVNDPEKAVEMSRGSLLVAWNNDANLLIDR